MSDSSEPAVQSDSPDYDPRSGEIVVGLQRLLGYRVGAWSDGFCRMVLPLDERHLNRFSGVHGGIYATLADAAGGFSGCYPDTPGLRRRCVTLSLTTNFLSQPGDGLLAAEAQVRGGGRSIFFSDIEIRDGGGLLLCTASGTFRYREPLPARPGEGPPPA
ncbi:uncharacterized domain 1-containing protein [Tistlia consotensis]|uniref:Uncharacterized domain 1-containing protein n=1 Tax=Tistlia consotensis USBA 355 TaxID=560819 RepID=A0A1Y6C0P8_9PROT|nr:PaaI family thioesterase [Tistlia consotensis]SMF30375.1 uncharacterized domain 1-containing protein [Tistlia consotensis USBA 355]SNR90105.1 uncharacterized domain 1-containing protein [Tistlia consotensis]